MYGKEWPEEPICISAFSSDQFAFQVDLPIILTYHYFVCIMKRAN